LNTISHRIEDLFSKPDNVLINQTFCVSSPYGPICVKGSWDNWVSSSEMVRCDDNTWKITIPLPPGVYQFKFIDAAGVYFCSSHHERTEHLENMNNYVVLQK